MLMPTALPLGDLENPSEFIARHIGISAADQAHMLSVIGEASRRALIDSIVPRSIARARPMELPAAVTEAAALAELKAMAQKNQVLRSFIGQGYYGTHTPGVILRNILENPAWYTAYTPYQAEISQGRMEALVNFQTMVTDLTGMDIANASMLDEATAAAEAMTLARRSVKAKGDVIVVAGDCRHEEPAPTGKIRQGVACFLEGRHVGNLAQARGRRDGQDANVLQLAQVEARGPGSRSHASAKQVGQRLCLALVRDMDEVGPGLLADGFADDVSGRAVAPGREAHAMLGFPGHADQAVERFGGVVAPDRQHHRHGRYQGYRGEVLQAVRGRTAQDGVLHDGRKAQQDGVAVRRGLRHGRGCQHARRAGPGFDHHRLLPRRAQLFTDDASQRVQAASCRRGEDEADRPLGIGAGLGVGGRARGGLLVFSAISDGTQS